MRLAAAENRLSEWESYLDRLTPREVTVLQAFQKIEPQGEDREDIRQAVITAAICTAAKASRTPIEPSKILEAIRPFDKPVPKEVTPEQAAKGMARTRPKGSGSCRS